MKKCGTAAPGCSLVEQVRVPVLRRHAVFHGKACGYILPEALLAFTGRFVTLGRRQRAFSAMFFLYF
jgi:hypothetical protein